MSLYEIDIRFSVPGTPVSLKAKGFGKLDWMERVKNAALSALPQNWQPTDQELSLTIYDFPSEQPQGDVDNIIKRIQDAMNNVIYVDDKQVRRVVAHRFLPDEYSDVVTLPPLIMEAIANEPPFVYLTIRSNPFGDAQ